MSRDSHPDSDQQVAVPCSLYRGGTSRGLLILRRDLPRHRATIERALLRMFGSPDPRQIDGVGAGSPLTSKAMIVEPAETPGDDVQMTFAQVSVDTETVDWGGTCGNLTSAVGVFAIESGLVPAVAPVTVVRIRSINTGKRVAVHIPVRNGQVITEGAFAIPGVPRSGARVDLEWLEPAGAVTGKLLPTGRVRDLVTLADGRELDVSVVDAVNPVAFCEAGALGLRGTESADQLAERPDVLHALEQIRSAAAELAGIVGARDVATRVSPGVPKVAFVAPPAAYTTVTGTSLDGGTHDIQARLMSMQVPHRSYSVSGAICTAVAASIPGTVVADCVRAPVDDRVPFCIAHPYGVIDVRLDLDASAAGPPAIKSARVGRTARRIMSGLVYVPASVLLDGADREDGHGRRA